MTRADIENQMVGKKIQQINWQKESKDVGDNCIISLLLEDGTQVFFEGSGQIEVTDVWVGIE